MTERREPYITGYTGCVIYCFDCDRVFFWFCQDDGVDRTALPLLARCPDCDSEDGALPDRLSHRLLHRIDDLERRLSIAEAWCKKGCVGLVLCEREAT